MSFDDIKKKGMLSQIVSRVTGSENDIRKILSKSGALPGAKVRNTGNQSIPDVTNTALTFTTVVFDYLQFFSLTTPTRLTIRTPGIYLMNGAVQFAANATGTRGIAIRLNGVTYLRTIIESAFATYPACVEAITSYPLVAGDYIEFMAFQSSGGALNSLNSGVEAPAGEIQRLS